jgi:hypothetical protein
VIEILYEGRIYKLFDHPSARASSVLAAQGKRSLKALAHFTALDPESTTQAIDIDQAPPRGEGAASRRGRASKRLPPNVRAETPSERPDPGDAAAAPHSTRAGRT